MAKTIPITARAVAKHFGVTVETVNRWVRQNRIPYLRPSRRIVRFHLEEVERALREHARQSEGGDHDG